jgi:hypothetical protein
VTITYDTATNIGKTRMLIPDRDLSNAVFQDVEIQAFLDLNEANVRRSAAEALETIASDQAMTLKVIRLLDLSTDGRAVSQALLERAARLREAAVLAEDSEDGGLFDYAEMVTGAFTERERIWKQAQRDDDG